MRLTRVVVILAVVAAMAFCAALVVREATLLGDGTLVWSAPGWWTGTIAAGDWARAGAAGLAVLGLAALCLGLGWRLVAGGAPDEGVLEVGGGGSRVAVRVEALERSLEKALQAAIPALQAVRVRVTRRDQRLVTRTRVTVLATDLRQLHGRVLTMTRREIAGATGLEVAALELEIERVLSRRGGGA